MGLSKWVLSKSWLLDRSQLLQKYFVLKYAFLSFPMDFDDKFIFASSVADSQLDCKSKSWLFCILQFISLLLTFYLFHFVTFWYSILESRENSNKFCCMSYLKMAVF